MSDQTPSVDEMKAFNQQIIDEFRAAEGKVGGHFEGQMMAVVTTTGAKSGEKRTNPLVAGRNSDDHLYVIASAAGSPRHPAWYHNVLANPTVDVEVGTESFEATARSADEPERTELYAAMVARMPQFDEYQEGNPRTIPVVILERN